MPRYCPPDFMDPNPAAAAAPAPAITPGAFAVCPVMLLPVWPAQQCLCQTLYQMAFQQAVQHCAPPRLPRFSWN